MEKLTKEELLKVLAKAASGKKERKKRDMNEEQREEMLERLAKMRENSQKARAEKSKLKSEAKKAEAPTASTPVKINAVDPDLFEKKYGSTFDKMTDILGRLDGHLTEIKDYKKEKREERMANKKAISLPPEIKMEIKEKETEVSEPQPPPKPQQLPSPLSQSLPSSPLVIKKINYKNLSFGARKIY